MCCDADNLVPLPSVFFLLCQCHVNLHKPRCKGCKKPIATGDVITALKSKWHPECFCCAFCNKPFESESFFIGKSDGKPYDEACYRIKLRSEI